MRDRTFKQTLQILKQIAEMVTYIFRPRWMLFAMQFVGVGATVLLLGFSADVLFSAKGQVGGVAVNFSIENKAQVGIAVAVGGAILIVGVLLALRFHNPPAPRSQRLAELEDMYKLRGAADSVCGKFKEVHEVYVSAEELKDLMDAPNRTTRATSLRQARSIVEHENGRFELKSPKVPYKLLHHIFQGIYAIASFAFIGLAILTSASVAAKAWIVVPHLAVALFLIGLLMWSSLTAFGACNSALYLTKR